MKEALQKHCPITTVEGYNEDGNITWLLEYYLQTYSNPSNDGKGRFGIKIVRTNPDGTLDKVAETLAITDDYNEALAMIEHFAKGAVRPHTLFDMVEEWLSEKVFCKDDASCPPSLPSWHTYHVGKIV